VFSVLASDGAMCLGAKECIAYGGGVECEHLCGMDNIEVKTLLTLVEVGGQGFCWPVGSRWFKFKESGRNP